MKLSGLFTKVVLCTFICECIISFGFLSSPVSAASGVPNVPCGKWTNIRGSFFSVPSVLSALADNDIWGLAKSEVEHWDGLRWKLIPTVDTGDAIHTLTGIVALSPTDVWAVGSIQVNSITQTLTEHWNGQRFVVIPSPNLIPVSGVGFYSTSLTAVTAVPHTKHLFALGSTSAGPIMEYWDSNSWKIVSSPILKKLAITLNTITAFSEKNVWVVGSITTSNTPPTSSFDAFTAHWDGKSWSRVPTPALRGNATLNALTAVPGTQNLWAVGSFDDPINSFSNTLTEYWNGSSWQYVSSPDVSTDNATRTTTLSSVAALSSHDVWAVGAANYNVNYLAIIEHWDGHSWKLAPVTGLSPYERLAAIVRVPDTDHLWAVGEGDYNASIADYYCVK